MNLINITYENDEQEIIDIPGTKIVTESLKYNASLSSESTFKFGGCDTSSIRLLVADIDFSDIADRDIRVTIKDSETNNVLFDKEFCNTVVTDIPNQPYAEIMAFGFTDKLNVDIKDFYSIIPFPISMRELLLTVVGYLGFSVEGAEAIPDTIMVNNTIGKNYQINAREDVVRPICEASFTFCVMEGKTLHFYRPTQTVNVDLKSVVGNITYDNKRRMGYVFRNFGIIGDEGADAGSDSGYQFRNNNVFYGKDSIELNDDYGVLTSFMPRLQQFGIGQFTMQRYDENGKPYIDSEPFNKLFVVDDKYTLVAMKYELTGIQLLRETIISDIECMSYSDVTAQDQLNANSRENALLIQKVNQLEERVAELIREKRWTPIVSMNEVGKTYDVEPMSEYNEFLVLIGYAGVQVEATMTLPYERFVGVMNAAIVGTTNNIVARFNVPNAMQITLTSITSTDWVVSIYGR